MKLPTLQTILSSSKEKLDAAIAPIRARSIRAKADLELAKLEEKAASVETEVHQLLATKEINFDQLLNKMDEYDLTQRRVEQLNALIASLFAAPTTGNEA